MNKDKKKVIKKPRKKASEKVFNYDVKDGKSEFLEFKRILKKGCKTNEKEFKNPK
jgi:hypothetical protein